MSGERLYGNWLRPQRATIRGVGWKTSALVVAGYFTGLVLLQTAPPVGLFVLSFCAVLTLGSAARLGGLTLAAWIGGKARWLAATRTQGRRGVVRFTAIPRPTPVPDASGWVLPGPLAGTRLLEVTDGAGRVYGVVHHPRERRLAATLLVSAMGADLLDPGVHDTHVGRWERWLEALGRRPEIHHVTVTVDTTPATGARLRDTLTRRLAPDAPADCRDLVLALIDTAPPAAAQTRIRVTITFDQRAWDTQLPHHTRDLGRRGDRVSAHLPLLDHALTGIHATLDGCGVTVTGRATPTELAGILRAAYDPAHAGAVELAGLPFTPDAAPSEHAGGAPSDTTLVYAGGVEMPGWKHAGPVAAREHRDAYVHDTGTSTSWVWAQAPRQLVTSRVLDSLTRPGSYRKRFTCTYTPTPAGEAMRASTDQVRWRRLASMVAALPVVGRASTAADDHDTHAALQSAREVAAGAGWTALTVTVTVTVTDPHELAAAIAETEHAATTSQLRLRRLYEHQAAGFHTGLPTGLTLTDLTHRWTR